MNNFYNRTGWDNAVYANAANTANTYQPEPAYTQHHVGYGEESMAYAMAYVRTQPWGELYDDETGLKRGTIFPVLDFPWKGDGGGSAL